VSNVYTHDLIFIGCPIQEAYKPTFK
jgi:hypothetical protein